MCKKVVEIVVFLLIVNGLNAQKFMHSYGATISVMSAKLNSNAPGSIAAPNYNNFSVMQTCLTYYPRYNFIENENSSVSIGMPLSVGIGLFTNVISDDAGISFAYDLPIALDYNIGFKSTRENPKKFGYFFGAGFGYYRVDLSKSQYSNYTGASYGMIYRAGIRFGSSKADWGNKGVMIGMFYKKGLEDAKFTTIGTHVLVDL